MLRSRYTLLLFLLVLTTGYYGCQKEISAENQTTTAGTGSSSGTSVYSFTGSPGNCTGAIVSGTFTAGTALSAGDSITLSVRVDSIGTYILSTATANGFSFSGSGSFTSTGNQTITLHGNGTPAASGMVTFIPGTNGCSFSVTVLAATNSNASCKSCTYYPFCSGSRYVFIDTVFGTAAERKDTLVISRDTTISGKVFNKATTNTGAIPVFHNCTSNETRLIIFNAVSTTGNNLMKIDLIYLKANLPVGGTWTDIVTNTVGQNVEYVSTIKEKGISRTVMGVVYNDVIHVQVITQINLGAPFGYYQTGVADNYFARGVGPIESINVEPNSGMQLSHSILKSYYIP